MKKMIVALLLLLLSLNTSRTFNIDTNIKVRFQNNDGILFGQNVVQYSHGILVSSPLYTTDNRHYGRIEKCDLKRKLCEAIKLTEAEKSRIRPGFTMAISFLPSQFLVCRQHQKRLSKNSENLNGVCTILSPELQETHSFEPVSLVKFSTGDNSSNNNNNNKLEKHEDFTGKIKLITTNSKKKNNNTTKKDNEFPVSNNSWNNSNNNNNNGNNDKNKDLEKEKVKQSNENSNNNKDKKENDDEFPGTEIAIVLDGSGSIEEPDFQKAKDFIINIAKNIWKRCLECEFALVQFGMEIKTIFDLNDSQEISSGIFSIVRNMLQLGQTTKTASAIQHVLDNIFNETRGSNRNAKRFIIVVTDGEIFRDDRNLTDVINSDKMVNITRIAVGVGPAFKKEAAFNELKLIASDPDETHLFQVDNYSALDSLLTNLEKNIVGIEGTQGVNISAFQMELAQAGFSADYADGNILLGAVGAYDWSGGVIMYNQETGALFLNETKGTLEAAYSYLGYSVASVKGMNGQHLYVAGAPRHSQTGQVLVFQAGTSVKIKQHLAGKQLGSYFGSELCSLDINNDNVTDYLLVGAPFFHVQGEEGMVYIYQLNDKNTFEEKDNLTGISSYTNARFGVAIANIGDINMDGYNDVAIGAPLEEDHRGSIYIFNGHKDGIHKAHSQRISGKDVLLEPLYFGQSVAGSSDVDTDGILDITVGAQDNVVVLSSRPVINIGTNVTFFPKLVPLSFTTSHEQEKIIQVSVCFTAQSKFASLDLKNSYVNYTINLDTKQKTKRVTFAMNDGTPDSISDYVRISLDACKNYSLIVQHCTMDCVSAIIVEVNYTLNNTEKKPGLPLPILDHFSNLSSCVELKFQKDCGSDNICKANLKLESKLPENFTWIVGKTKEVSLNILLSNTGEDSYLTTMDLSYPKSLFFKGISKPQLADVKCTDQATSSLSFLNCEIFHPVFKRNSQVEVSISWDLGSAPFKEEFACVSVNVSNKNEIGNAVHNTHNIPVRHGLNVFLKAENQITEVDIRNKAVDETVKYNFQVTMENPYNASVNLTLSIPVKIQDRQILQLQQESLKHCLKTQKIFKQQPEQKIKDQWDCDMHECECWYFQCELTAAKQDIDLTARLPVNNLKQIVKDRADIVISGVVVFDEKLYQETSDAKDIHHNVKMHVTIVNTPVFNAIPVVAGSTVGGILLLLLIILILYKCGFFKRSYKDMIEFEEETEH
ncbi:integrin alpha-E-like isoform X1 [Chiloscyllium plagiosum]|uniref:integrin alpha-E-like isoform X1 n=2 Tax=Chiloscyllium plagiosum TaxID=36176 RepID=UPI001CB7D62F|nr:integrin alpha-E-like isoform X1 [Chiloscyllium plagiosum]